MSGSAGGAAAHATVDAVSNLERLHAAFGARLLTQAERRAPYEIPERGAPGTCPAVLLPDSQDEVRQALEMANASGLHVVLSAGRTGLVEAQRPQGEVVLSLERLRRFIALRLPGGAACTFEPTDGVEAARDRLFAWWESQGRPSLDGAVIVTTPQEVALADARRAHTLFQRVGVPTLGLIENMSGPVFGRGGAEAEAARLSIPFLGDLPLDASLREASDAGRPLVVGNLDSEITRRFAEVAAAVAGTLGL